MRIHSVQLQRGLRDLPVDAAGAAYLRIVPHAPQEPIGDARSSPRAQRDLRGSVTIDRHMQHLGRAFDNESQLAVLLRSASCRIFAAKTAKSS